MKKALLNIKEELLYIGIILLCLLSASILFLKQTLSKSKN